MKEQKLQSFLKIHPMEWCAHNIAVIHTVLGNLTQFEPVICKVTWFKCTPHSSRLSLLYKTLAF